MRSQQAFPETVQVNTQRLEFLIIAPVKALNLKVTKETEEIKRQRRNYNLCKLIKKLGCKLI